MKMKNEVQDFDGHVWTHMLKNHENVKVYFGLSHYWTEREYAKHPEGIEFALDRQGSGYLFKWLQAREFAETILKLCDKYGGGDD